MLLLTNETSSLNVQIERISTRDVSGMSPIDYIGHRRAEIESQLHLLEQQVDKDETRDIAQRILSLQQELSTLCSMEQFILSGNSRDNRPFIGYVRIPEFYHIHSMPSSFLCKDLYYNDFSPLITTEDSYCFNKDLGTYEKVCFEPLKKEVNISFREKTNFFPSKISLEEEQP